MRSFLFAAATTLALVTGAAAQSFDTPQALLEAFYEPYFGAEFADDDTVFRSERLNALYAADEASTPLGDLGALDFDPYIDAQDYELTDFTIGEPAITGDKAVVEVSFNNMNHPTALTYELVNENGWKIDDVVSANDEYPYRLSQIFTDAAAAAE